MIQREMFKLLAGWLETQHTFWLDSLFSKAHVTHRLIGWLDVVAQPPSQHVQFLLEEDDEDHKTHDLFCEMGELFTQDGEMTWKETAR